MNQDDSNGTGQTQSVPERRETVLLRRNLGSSRYIYNQCLEYAEYAYGKDGFARLITRLKDIPEYSWLRDADSTSLQSAAKNAHKAYLNMFAGKAERGIRKRSQAEIRNDE